MISDYQRNSQRHITENLKELRYPGNGWHLSSSEPYGQKSYDEVIKDLSDDIYLECPEKIRKSILGLEKNFSARLFQNASLRTNKKEQILVKLLKSYQVC